MTDLEQFLDFLYGQAEGYAYSPVKVKDAWHQEFFQMPNERVQLINHVLASAIIGDVYISPALYSEKKVSKQTVSFAQVVWIEFDGKKDLSYHDVVKPDTIVQTSTSKHIHAYWRIEPTTSFELIENINRRLTYYFEADSSGWDATQVLRPPGTVNHKYSPTLPVGLLKCAEGKVHDFAAFDIAPEIKPTPADFTYDDLLDPELIYKEHAIPLILKNRNRRELVLPGNRSTFLMQTGHLLAEEGLDFKEILTLLYEVDCRIKKFPGRSDQLLRLSEIASIALAKFEVENTVAFYTPNEIINHKSNLKWIIEGWLHTQGIMILSGEPGVGKTQFCLDLAYRLATNKKILTKPPTLASVMFISLEMTVEELQYIFSLQSRDFNEDKEQWDRNLKVFAQDELNYTLIEKAVREHRPQVIIIDSLSELCLDEMKELEARKVMTWLKKMRRQFNVAEIIIHHNRKAQDGNKKPRKLSDLYGSFIFGKLSETVLSLWQDDGKSYLELHSLKTRFGKKDVIHLERSENLTFTKKADIKLDVSGTSSTKHNPLLGFQ